MKFTKKNKIVMGAVSGAIAVAVIMTAILLAGKTPSPVIRDSESETPSSEVVIKLPTDDITEIESSDPTGKENDNALVIDVDGNPESPSGTGNNGSKNNNPAKPPEKPVNTKKPEQPAGSNGGISIGGDDHNHTPYNCGTANHKCNSPESHAFIANLELDGCEYCGSNSCPSFYGTDEWGNSGLFPKLCSKYNIKKDPLYYCQNCSKKVGDGTNGTCVQFVNACKCPLCGTDVPARTCHSCK